MPYAAKTSVPITTTRAEIEKVLRKAGARRIVTMDEPIEALVAFELALRTFKITVDVPGNALDQRRRSLWRALLLIIKAKLEAVEQGISTAEREFLAFVVLPDGTTAGEWLTPQIERVYERGGNLKLLADYSGRAMGREFDPSHVASATPIAYGLNEFIPLAEAARIAFPAGAVKASSLRLEASRGRLTVYRIAGKVMTTLADVRKMADQCRVEPSLPVSGSDPRPPTAMPSGSSSTEDVNIARAALRQKLDKLKRSSSSISPPSTVLRSSGSVLPIRPQSPTSSASTPRR